MNHDLLPQQSPGIDRKDPLYKTLKDGGVIEWTEIPDEDKVKLCQKVVEECLDEGSSSYNPEELIAAPDPLGAWSSYSKEKTIDNLPVIMYIASQIHEVFHGELGNDWKSIGRNPDGNSEWTKSNNIFDIAEFIGLCVASGVLEYTDGLSEDRPVTRVANLIFVRATPGFRQYIQSGFRTEERLHVMSRIAST